MNYIIYFMKKLYSSAGKILYVNLFGMVLISLLEGIGIILLLPMISMTGIINTGEETSFIAPAYRILQNFPKTTSLISILGIYVLIVLSQNILQRNITLRDARTQQVFVRKLRVETYSMILKAKWRFFLEKRKTNLINILTTELARVSYGINLILQLLATILFTFIQVGLAFLLSPQVTVFVLGFGLLFLVASRVFIKKARILGGKTSELAKDYLSGITDHFNGIKDIKSNTLEGSRLDWFQSITKKMSSEQMEYMRIRSNSQLFYKISMAILIAFFIFLSVNMFQAQTAQLLLIILIFSRLWPRFMTIQSNLEQLAASIPAFKSLWELQQECNEAVEMQDIYMQKHIKPICIKQGIECKDVSFRYNKQEALYALQNINVQIPINSMTAIVGHSGAGKSTLIDVLMGLIQPEKGRVLIDGTPLTTDNLLSLRRAISYVPQDPFLFNASIRENLMMIDSNVNEEQIWAALEFAAATEFVRMLPNGLDTLIGDRGVRLSGGERQRLVLARAILRKPSILVLDEATSALDTENEVKIQSAIERLKGTMTIVVIAHRLSTIRNADQVIVLGKGEIVQKGEFNQLAKERKGVFQNLLGSQMEVGS
ncbi:ABC transporter ATP-binding protein [Bacillus toyonensis]|uniref:ABC transporter ATP-binding protein n=1 Tax=Bacillus toyonensis TaxID=155322 RepID=A0AB36T002_9BACI|nr:ATP-binding cassette domain-containing protein [Bacillus toyonensis]EEL59749.2 Phosphonate ABC transporter permease [Bacillus cereus Rock4-18]PEC09240.1 ABC transporter ATP-binding protein [Bacillus toyonensis]PEN59625.1 ABC transporter ATP-binding protein [Bacillus toyonensis]PEN86489.1 ABC transporter ATP-binding protein [Bacillus toyonensis]PGD54791.1 ABC transporter ATP-binding protein [Bacillus toyonensis]